MKKILITALALFSLTACGQGRRPVTTAQSESNENELTGNGHTALKFELPAIPSIYVDPQDRASYLIGHYWDNFDFKNTDYIDLPEVTEQAFADFIDMTRFVPREEAVAAIRKMMKSAQASPEMFDYFTGITEKYLYDPNSPMRNEELFIPVLGEIIAYRTDDIDRIRPKAQLEMAMKNRVGHAATDFTATLADGSKVRLYDIRKDYVILFINNPDCNACGEIIREMKSSEIIVNMIAQGRLAVFAVYPDEDLRAWREHRKDIPDTWIYSYDASLRMRNEQLYDLKAIPTIYLLDNDKTVLIKDAASAVPIEMYLYQAEMGR